jgi:hypothetical protein
MFRHPFDSCKYRNVVKHLKKKVSLEPKDLIEVTKMADDKILK